MEVAPPPASGVRLQEVDDHLIVRFRPRRSQLVFLSVWLTGWTGAGVGTASQLPKVDPGDRAFLLFWLCGWFFGECVVIGVIAWQLFGRELLAVTSLELVNRKGIGRFALTRSYDASQVRDITAERVPHDEDEKPREDFCLRLSYDDEVVLIGEGMGEREAEWVASVVLARTRPRSWWSEDDDARSHPAYMSSPPLQAVLEAGRFHVLQPSPARAVLWAGAAIACVTLGGTLLLGVFGSDTVPRSAPQAGKVQPTPDAVQAQRLPPSREDFQTARKYGEAMTSYVLSSGDSVLLGRPRCGARATWTHWSCRAPAKATIGPFAGRALPYRCAATDTGGSGTGVICGPDRPFAWTAPTGVTSGTDERIDK